MLRARVVGVLALLTPLLFAPSRHNSRRTVPSTRTFSLGVGRNLRATRRSPSRIARPQQLTHIELRPHDAVDARVSGDVVAAYQRDGVVHLPGVFGQDWVELMREAFAMAVQRPSAHAETTRTETPWWNPFEDGSSDSSLQMFMDHFFFEEVAGRAPAWAAVAESSPAARIMARLMGSSTAAFFYGQLIMKRGGAEQDIPWHQDLPYWKVDGSQIGTVWIALDDMPAEAGVRYIPGSHRSEQLEQFFESPPGMASAVSFDVKAGDAICFDARVIHGSTGSPETPDHVHRRVALRFGGDDAVYWSRSGHAPIPTAEVDKAHGLRHGDPLFCAAFPRVYAASGSRSRGPRQDR